jgi:hypothetical protein
MELLFGFILYLVMVLVVFVLVNSVIIWFTLKLLRQADNKFKKSVKVSIFTGFSVIFALLILMFAMGETNNMFLGFVVLCVGIVLIVMGYGFFLSRQYKLDLKRSLIVVTVSILPLIVSMALIFFFSWAILMIMFSANK